MGLTSFLNRHENMGPFIALLYCPMWSALHLPKVCAHKVNQTHSSKKMKNVKEVLPRRRGQGGTDSLKVDTKSFTCSLFVVVVYQLPKSSEPFTDFLTGMPFAIVLHHRGSDRIYVMSLPICSNGTLCSHMEPTI